MRSLRILLADDHTVGTGKGLRLLVETLAKASSVISDAADGREAVAITLRN